MSKPETIKIHDNAIVRAIVATTAPRRGHTAFTAKALKKLAARDLRLEFDKEKEHLIYTGPISRIPSYFLT